MPSASSSSNKSTSSSDDIVLTSAASPPWHAVVLLGIMTAVFVHQLPTLQQLDDKATVATFTTPKFVSLRVVGWIRLTIAVIIWATSFQVAVLSQGWYQETTYLTESKLQRVPNHLKGFKTMMPFTSWSWNLLGLAFTLSAYIAFVTVDNNNKSISPWILRAALVSWELAAPFALLVAFVIRYVIWPNVLKAKSSSVNLKHTRNKLMHNANVLFAIMETALLGHSPVVAHHVAMAPLVGILYVLFSWAMIWQWNTPSVGPQFIYFFFDTTLPRYQTSIALIFLLIVLMMFYGLFCVAEWLLLQMGGGLILHLLFVLVVCSSVMRFRD